LPAQNGCPASSYSPLRHSGLAEHCRALHLPFVDTAGNAYLEAPGLMVYVTGEPRPADVQNETRYRAFTAAGMKILFVVLCRPQLAEGTYRDIARAAGVALGAVGPVVRDLETRGFLVQRENRTLTNTRKLAEEWVTRFPRRQIFGRAAAAASLEVKDLRVSRTLVQRDAPGRESSGLRYCRPSTNSENAPASGMTEISTKTGAYE
jgi:hypothetical protein